MKKLLLLTVLLFGLHAESINALQKSCSTIEQIEKMNKNKLKKVAHVKDKNAILLIFLDPVLSEPEFKGKGSQDKHFIAAIKRLRKNLIKQGIDEVVIWNLSSSWGGMMGAAVPFKNGCAVQDYGEPDLLEKLIQMHKVYLLISKYGLNSKHVRKGIKELLMKSRYKREFDEKMIDIIINNLHTVEKQLK
ncbi:MAG TPA: hypothetical protein VIM88_04920 [Sulfurovum sp.]|uniref:hypothetical protein n=1 Tax=Sulfurovum sp. TaxID=1969726 RepID=UPI002F93B6ED